MLKAVILGCGYVGVRVAQLWQPTLAVTATTTTPARVAELEPIAHRVEVLKGSDEPGMRSLLQDQEIVLLAVGARYGSYADTYLKTAETLVGVLPHCPSVRQIIYTGSYAVYGDRGGEWVDETTSPAPANENGEVLAATEQLLLNAANEQLKVCVFRLGGIYGPGRELVKIFGRVAGTTRPGTGEDAANWVHLDDIVGAIDFACQQGLNGIYNLVGTVPLTSKELLDKVCSTHHLPSVSWDPTQPSLRPYNARVSNQKLRTAGYSFIHPEIQQF
jgi:nucleoside-diphosphate-sugar epimerase